MRCIVNGTTTELTEVRTVADLLAHLDLAAKPCAVEVNATVVPRRDHAGHELCDGDRIEVVTLVGGG